MYLSRTWALLAFSFFKFGCLLALVILTTAAWVLELWLFPCSKKEKRGGGGGGVAFLRMPAGGLLWHFRSFPIGYSLGTVDCHTPREAEMCVFILQNFLLR